MLSNSALALLGGPLWWAGTALPIPHPLPLHYKLDQRSCSAQGTFRGTRDRQVILWDILVWQGMKGMLQCDSHPRSAWLSTAHRREGLDWRLTGSLAGITSYLGLVVQGPSLGPSFFICKMGTAIVAVWGYSAGHLSIRSWQQLALVAITRCNRQL